MPRAQLIYRLPEEREEFELAQKAGAYAAAIHDISQDVFRPARKHGYPDREIADMIRKIDGCIPEELRAEVSAEELIGLLEKKYYEILNNWEVGG